MSQKRVIFICGNRRAGGAGCMSQGAVDVWRALLQRAKERGDRVEIKKNVCMGYCGQGPNVKILGGAFYHGVTPEGVDEILDAEEAQND